MIPIDLWSAEGRAEMRAHLDLIGEIEEAEAKLRTLEAQLPAWLGRRGAEGQTNDTLGHEALARAKAWLDDQDTHEITPAEAAAVTTPLYERPPLPLLGDATEGPIPAPAPATPEEIAAWVEGQTAKPAPAEASTPAAEDQTDPERWIDDAMKAEIWRLDQEGYTAAGIASEMSLAQRRVQNLLYRIKSGKHPVPSDPAASTALTTTSTNGALVVPERSVARDPEMVQQWQDEMAEAERRKFVARSEYPEMQA